jgi:hypothetical protein
VWLSEVWRRLVGGRAPKRDRGPSRRAVVLALAAELPGPGSTATIKGLAAGLRRRGYATRVAVKRRPGALRRAARAAARGGAGLVVAAGGRRTAAAAARGLAGSATPLCLAPAESLAPAAPERVPSPAPPQAVPVSLGRVTARGLKRPRLFFEGATAGPADPFLPVEVEVRLGGTAFWQGLATAVEVRNLALPGATPDGAPLEVHILPAPADPVELPAGPAPSAPPPAGIGARAPRIEVRARRRLPVVADGKVVGTTPATFSSLPGALRLARAPVANGRALVRRVTTLPQPGGDRSGEDVPLAPLLVGPPSPASPETAPLALTGGGRLGLLVGGIRPAAAPLVPALVSALVSAAGGAILGALAVSLLQRRRSSA